MFNLTATHRYLVYPHPVDMRKSFNALQGIVTNEMGMNARSGDVYVFISSNCKMIKLLHKEMCGMVIYAMRLDYGRVKPPVKYNISQESFSIDHLQLKSMIQASLDSAYVRQLKFAAACFQSV